ncbi:hypothetical protein P9112_012418 [Eukaryota sp. TZLM1-RC]
MNTSDSSDSSDFDDEFLAALEEVRKSSTSNDVSSLEPPRTKNEVDNSLEDNELNLPSNPSLLPLGTVHSYVRNALVVQSYHNAHQFNIGAIVACQLDTSVLPLGKVYDVFGPMDRPFYAIHVVSSSLTGDNLTWQQVGTEVMVVEDPAFMVSLTEVLPTLKQATDASNFHDEEAPDPEFSDDEEEALWKLEQKQRRRFANVASKEEHDINQDVFYVIPSRP